MKIRINDVRYPVTALGPGRRLAIWVQGCHIGCRGCMSRDTWDPKGGTELEIDELVAVADRCFASDGLDGVTISGGEPFEQPEALRCLLEGLVAWRNTTGAALDLLCYSGMSHRRVVDEFPQIVDLLDALIPEPFVSGRGPGGIWRGSANQPLVMVSDLGRERYAQWEADRGERRPMQVSVVGNEVTVVGVPTPGALDDIEEQVERAGIQLDGMSWDDR